MPFSFSARVVELGRENQTWANEKQNVTLETLDTCVHCWFSGRENGCKETDFSTRDVFQVVPLTIANFEPRGKHAYLLLPALVLIKRTSVVHNVPL